MKCTNVLIAVIIVIGAILAIWIICETVEKIMLLRMLCDTQCRKNVKSDASNEEDKADSLNAEKIRTTIRTMKIHSKCY